MHLELRLLLSLNKNQTLCFGECESKKQLNIILGQNKEGKRALGLLSDENIVFLITSQSFLYVDFMHEFPLPFRQKGIKILQAERRGEEKKGGFLYQKRLFLGQEEAVVRRSFHLNLNVVCEN